MPLDYMDGCTCQDCRPETEHRRAQMSTSGAWKTSLSAQFDEQRRKATESKATPATPTTMEDPEVSNSRIYDAADRAVREELTKRETERITAEKIALVDAYGEDGFAEQTVIRFTKQYSKNGTAYTFVAVKFDESAWRTSSQYDGESNRDWSSLVELLVSGPVPTTSIDVMAVASTYPASAAAPKTDAKS